MNTMTKGQRVGVKIFELDTNGKLITLPPKFFGVVVETSEDGKNGYVHLDVHTEEHERTFFDISELEPENAE